ncbi:sugar-phosphate nucleotidyltransferase [Mycoplasma nasistruthionis]|uniref:Sugar-phosphate nucleotidyltransferase n=1 Tax=Mycoplasma nasistruthionis TaxID=353852 RepID=A0A4Y6I7B6_9MOLU|nr:sugar-phosphate nucleotidyltransferase [Mycoplasma nasistruthionis]QCZ36506.1 sugar-phosphate nucleotidyltransferase [Mycoplasma nasistruthionis]QDF64798.1 sugar-phosphate nucleotidyltransferase [Mycoplasma nasistruthionis]
MKDSVQEITQTGINEYVQEMVKTAIIKNSNDITRAFRYANDDEWYTTYEDVEFFIKTAKIPKTKVIWCPFDLETSNFVKAFRDYGYKVIYSHILYEQDFYKYEPNEKWDIIVSNPPFRNKHNLLKRLLEFGSNKQWALIFGIQALNSEKFCDELQKFDRVQYIHLKRRMCFTKDHLNYDVKNLQRPSFASMWIANSMFKKDIQVWEGINYKNIEENIKNDKK